MEKGGTLGKVLQTWKSAAHLEECSTLEKVRHTKKSAHKKMRHPLKGTVHLEESGTLGKVRHT